MLVNNKNIDIFNLTVSLGNIMFASNFLATDILSEKYSKDYAYKAVIIGLVMNLLFTFFMQIALLYIPSSTDISNESMKTLFNLNLRVSLNSSLLYFLSNYLDIYLFNSNSCFSSIFIFSKKYMKSPQNT